MRLVICILLTFCSLYKLSAQNQEFLNAYNLKNTNLQQGNINKVDSLCQVMSKLLPQNFHTKDAIYAAYASDIGTSYNAIQNYPQALKWYEEATEVYTEVLGSYHEYTAVTVYNLANVNYALGNNDAAEKAYIQAYLALDSINGTVHSYTRMALESLINFLIEIEKKEELLTFQKAYVASQAQISGESSLELAVELNYLATIQSEMGYNSDAIKNYKQSLDILQEIDNQKENIAIVAYNLGLLYINTGNYIDAEPLMLLYKSYLEDIDMNISNEYGATLSHLGELYRMISDYANSEKYFLRALDLIQQLETDPGSIDLLTSLNNLGYLYKEMGLYDKAEKYLLEAKNACLDNKLPVYETILNNLGLVYMELGFYEIAEAHFLEAIEMEPFVTAEDYSIVLNNIGLLYFYMGLFEKAESYFDQALDLKAKTYGKEHPFYATTLLNIANVLTSKGDFNKAEELYRESIGIYTTQLGKEDTKVATALNNLGEMYVALGNYETGFDSYYGALKIYEAKLGKEHTLYTSSLNGIALTCRYTGQWDLAEHYYKESADIRKRVLGPSHPDYIISLMNLAELYDVWNQLPKADSLYKILNDYYRGKNTGDYLHANFLNNYGSILMTKGQCFEAISYYEEGLELRKTIYGPEHQLYAESLNNLASAYDCIGRFKDAYDAYKKSNTILIKQIRDKYPYLSEADKAKFFHTINFQFEGFVSFAAKWSNEIPTVWNDVYNNQLIFKGLLLDETSKLRQMVEMSDQQDLKADFEKWKSQKEYLSHLYTLDLEALQTRAIDLKQEEELANQYETVLNKHLHGEMESNAATYKDVAAKLKPGEAAVEMIRVQLFSDGHWQDTVYYVALILTSKTTEGPELILMKNGNFMETKGLTAYRNQTKFKLEDKRSYGHFWEPIQKKLDSLGEIEVVYLSRDGVYNNLNIQGLMNPESGEYLIDNLNIVLLSNTRDVNSDISALPLKNVSLYGNPSFNYDFEIPKAIQDSLKSQSKNRAFNFNDVSDLPGTKQEIEQIESILIDKGIEPEIFQALQATEDHLKSVSNPSILHIATHGYFLEQEAIGDKSASDRNPLLKSGLLLTGANTTLAGIERPYINDEDGILTAYEVTNMSLYQTQLVVLSACETGLGDIVNGEGVYGLQRAFGIAGASSVLMSLWKVDDFATKELMTTFYTNLLNGQDKRKALKNAQGKLKEKYPEPYYWASFVLIDM